MNTPTPARMVTAPADLSDLPETLVDALDRAERHGRAGTRGLRFVDLRENEVFLPWTEVIGRARTMAAKLLAHGVVPGDRVALFFATGPAFFDGFFGALLAGAVPTPLYPPVRLGKMDEYDRRTARMLQASGAAVVLSEARIARFLGGVNARYRAPLGTVTPRELTASRGRDSRLEPAQPPPVASDLALVQFSSGTTARSKPVALSHAALLHQGAILAGHWPDTKTQEQAGVSWLPLYHDMGLIGCVVPALLRVANLWLIPPELFLARPALWLRTLSRTGASVSPAPNFAYSLCVERVKDRDLKGVDLSSWRAALNGAEAVSMETVKAFERRFGAFGFNRKAMTPVYGLAEAALAVTFSDLDEAPHSERFSLQGLAQGRAVVLGEGRQSSAAVPGEEKASLGVDLVSVGRPVPGFSVEVRDPKGKLLNEDQEGEVFIAGPSLLTAYLGCDEGTEQALQDGWLATGDLGFIHRGELFLTSRKKDVLVLRGRNWSPEPVEELVSGVTGVRTGCVVAFSGLLPNAARQQAAALRTSLPLARTEQLWVIAETRCSADALEGLEDDCVAAVRGGLGLEVARLDLVEPGEIPRTSSGKLRRSVAKARAEAGLLRAAGSANLVARMKRRPAVAAGLALLHSRREAAKADTE